MFDMITLKIALPQVVLVAVLCWVCRWTGLSDPVAIAATACALSNLGVAIGLVWIRRTGGLLK